MPELNEGWVFPTRRATKAHYIREGRSLCGRYGYFGTSFDELEQEAASTPDDCKACAAKLVRHPKKLL